MLENIFNRFDSETNEIDLKENKGIILGIYLFLISELMLFFALFFCYFFYYYFNYNLFKIAHNFLDIKIGLFNTLLMLFSSFTIFLSYEFYLSNDKKKTFIFLFFTILFGIFFLYFKFYEYSHKIEVGLLPGYHYKNGLLPEPDRIHVFFSFYFLLTGAHIFHLIIGLFFVFLSFFFIYFRTNFLNNLIFLRFSNLYWHMVDIIWLIIFFLLYIFI